MLQNLMWVLGAITLVAGDPRRNISSPDINLGCSPQAECKEPLLINVTARGLNDSVHHLWGTHGALTFLVVKTDLNTNLNVDWTNFLASSPNSVNISEPNYVFGFAIPNLILFSDINDTGKLDNSTKAWIVVPMTDFKWKVVDSSKDSIDEAGIVLETTEFRKQLLSNDTKIRIEVAAFGKDGRSSVLPHLIRTPNSAQLDIILENLVLDLNSTVNESFKKEDQELGISGFINPRWALDLIIISSEEIGEEGIQLSAQRSLDDENTPGVFHLDEITTPLARKTKHGGYMQWRPVSYLSQKRDINVATTPNINSNFVPLNNISKALKESLAYAIFGDNLMSMLTANTTVAFGQSNDNFYTEYNYTTWTVALGQGYPPKETFSTMVIIVISLGIGIPILIFLIGGIVVAYRRCHEQSEMLIDN